MRYYNGKTWSRTHWNTVQSGLWVVPGHPGMALGRRSSCKGRAHRLPPGRRVPLSSLFLQYRSDTLLLQHCFYEEEVVSRGFWSPQLTVLLNPGAGPLWEWGPGQDRPHSCIFPWASFFQKKKSFFCFFLEGVVHIYVNSKTGRLQPSSLLGHHLWALRSAPPGRC